MANDISRYDCRRILSRPFPVEWAGWSTTTTKLQYAGWQMATQYAFENDNYRFMFKHDQLDLMGYADWLYIERSVARPYCTDSALPVIRVGHVARQFHMVKPIINEGMTTWHLIDAKPQLCIDPIRTMEDFSVFAKLQPKEILIPRADMSVVEQLEAIIRAQEPKQHELRQIVLDKARTVRPLASLAEVA